MKCTIQVSAGELYDKLSILQIKSKKIKDKKKLEFIMKEYDKLCEITNSHFLLVENLYYKLYSVNKKLWDLENTVRKLENKKEFGKKFIKSARNIYKYNDKRALIKNKINIKCNSEFREIKQHF